MRDEYYWRVRSVFSQTPELLPFKKAVVPCCHKVPEERLRQKVANLLLKHPELKTFLGPLVEVPRG
jgi:hypothetical protein